MRQPPPKTAFADTLAKLMAAILAIPPVLALVGGVAAAGEFCVTCAEPDAHYACTFDGADNTNDASLKLLCITELAKSGKHGSCSVDRAQVKPCAGAVKTMAAPEGYQAPAAAPGAVEAAKPAAIPAAPQAAKPASATPGGNAPAAPPKTVQEMVEKGTADAGQALEKTGDTAAEAAKSTGSTLGKIGKATGDAAKKTWTCITSLFGDC